MRFKYFLFQLFLLFIWFCKFEQVSYFLKDIRMSKTDNFILFKYFVLNLLISCKIYLNIFLVWVGKYLSVLSPKINHIYYCAALLYSSLFEKIG